MVGIWLGLGSRGWELEQDFTLCSPFGWNSKRFIISVPHLQPWIGRHVGPLVLCAEGWQGHSGLKVGLMPQCSPCLSPPKTQRPCLAFLEITSGERVSPGSCLEGSPRASAGRTERTPGAQTGCHDIPWVSAPQWITSYRMTIFLPLSGHVPLPNMAVNSLGPRALTF